MKHLPITALLIAGTFITAPVEKAAAQGANILQATVGDVGGKTSEVSTETMRRVVADGSAMIVDSRSQAEFDAGHIPGAVAISGPSGPGQVSAVDRLTGSDKGKALILYCNGPYCQASRRLADALIAAGYTNVRRYQLGIPVWRALGGPTAVEIDGLKRVAAGDRLAVFIDARPAEDFAKGSLPHARSAPLGDVLSGKLKKIDLPEDDFNRRVILFGRDGAEARKLADVLSTRPWHNVAYFNGAFDAVRRLDADMAVSKEAAAAASRPAR